MSRNSYFIKSIEIYVVILQFIHNFYLLCYLVLFYFCYGKLVCAAYVGIVH